MNYGDSVTIWYQPVKSSLYPHTGVPIQSALWSKTIFISTFQHLRFCLVLTFFWLPLTPQPFLQLTQVQQFLLWRKTALCWYAILMLAKCCITVQSQFVWGSEWADLRLLCKQPKIYGRLKSMCYLGVSGDITDVKGLTI